MARDVRQDLRDRIVTGTAPLGHGHLAVFGKDWHIIVSPAPRHTRTPQPQGRQRPRSQQNP